MAAISRSRKSGSGHTEVDTQKISSMINGEEDHGEDVMPTMLVDWTRLYRDCDLRRTEEYRFLFRKENCSGNNWVVQPIGRCLRVAIARTAFLGRFWRHEPACCVHTIEVERLRSRQSVLDAPVIAGIKEAQREEEKAACCHCCHGVRR